MPQTRAALTGLVAPHPSGSAGTSTPEIPALIPRAEDPSHQLLWPLPLPSPNTLILGGCFLHVSVSPARPSSRQAPCLSQFCLSPVPSTVLVWRKCSVVMCGRREEGRTEGRKRGWKERKKGGNLGKKVLRLLLPDSPWCVRHVTSPRPSFVLTCERNTLRGLCTHQRDSRCKKSLAEGKSSVKFRGIHSWRGDPWRDGGSFPRSFICHHCQESISLLSQGNF